jgi:ribonuclease E
MARVEPAEAAIGSMAVDRDEHGEGDEAQRRRRGRRGGRRRGRRETGSEPIFADPRPALDTIEILPSSGLEESPAELEIVGGWPAELGVELGAEDADAGLEAASLPALAGDGMSPPMPDNRDGAASMGASITEIPATEMPAGAVIEVVDAAPSAQPAQAPDTMPLAAEPSAEPVGASAPGPETTVQAITEKPANPRRGWWQRLIQP